LSIVFRVDTPHFRNREIDKCQGAGEQGGGIIPPKKVGADLTEREREVLACIVEGLSNQQIAEKLVISLSTVKFHVSSILSKLHVNSRTEAVSYVLKNDLNS
jgi:DNA-binding NarL/FixJ family response regulator